MSFIERRKFARRALVALCACLLLVTLAPAASAQDEPRVRVPLR
jgi:hypothetical protein